MSWPAFAFLKPINSVSCVFLGGKSYSCWVAFDYFHYYLRHLYNFQSIHYAPWPLQMLLSLFSIAWLGLRDLHVTQMTGKCFSQVLKFFPWPTNIISCQQLLFGCLRNLDIDRCTDMFYSAVTLFVYPPEYHGIYPYTHFVFHYAGGTPILGSSGLTVHYAS